MKRQNSFYALLLVLFLFVGLLSTAGCRGGDAKKLAEKDKAIAALNSEKEELSKKNTAAQAALDKAKAEQASATVELASGTVAFNLPKEIKSCEELGDQFMIAVCGRIYNTFASQFDDAVRTKNMTEKEAEQYKAALPQNIMDVYLANLTDAEVAAKGLDSQPYRCITKPDPGSCFLETAKLNLGAKTFMNLGLPQNYGYVNAMDGIKQTHEVAKDTNVRVKDMQPRVKDIQEKVTSIKITGEDTNARVKDMQPKVNRTNEIAEAVFGKKVPASAPAQTTAMNSIPDAGKKTSSIPDRPDGGKKPGKKVSDADALWAQIQAGWDQMDKDKVCGAVKVLIGNKAAYQGQFSKRNWSNVESLASGYCKKQKLVNTILKSTTRAMSQGTCFNTVVDKLFGKPTECNVNIPQAISGYGLTDMSLRGVASVAGDGDIRETAAKIGDDYLGDDWFSKYRPAAGISSVISSTPNGDGPDSNPFGPGSGNDAGGAGGTIAGTTGDQYWTNGQHGIVQGSQTTWTMPAMDKAPVTQYDQVRAAGFSAEKVSAAGSASSLDAFGGLGSKKAGGLK